MVRTEVLRRRLEALGEYLTILRRLARYSRDEFLADPERYGSAERFLQLAVEATLDMGSHVIADAALGSINQGRDVPRIFREQGFIDPGLERRWTRMIGFRNLLVHDYLALDRELVHGILTGDLGDLERLGRVFAGFLDPAGD